MEPNDHKIDPDALINPSSGLYVRNPTRIDISADAEDQRDIVDAIKGERQKRMKVRYEYEYDEKGNLIFSGLPGLVKIREMTEIQMAEFCRSLMRCRPNIIGLDLNLGEYDSAKEYRGRKTEKLAGRKPRNPTDIAKDMTDLLSDQILNIVRIHYQINSASVGVFESTVKVLVTSEEEYQDDKRFKPTLEVEYITS